jgi:hypothetical protein
MVALMAFFPAVALEDRRYGFWGSSELSDVAVRNIYISGLGYFVVFVRGGKSPVCLQFGALEYAYYLVYSSVFQAASF